MGWSFCSAFAGNACVAVMRIMPTDLKDVLIIDMEKHGDDRGWFARAFCEEEFSKLGISFHVTQTNISFNQEQGTVRGLHYQAHPKWEPKIVRCTRGRIFDVAVDLRPQSASFCKWVGVELSPENGRALYLPPGMAHGFQTLTENCELYYLMGEVYDPSLVRGVRWDDPVFAIKWPLKPTIISDRDKSFPDFKAKT